MHHRLASAALAATLINAFPVHAIEDEAAIVVTAARIPSPDTDATYASEVHTRRMIDQSGAQTLFDYLSHHTSINVRPSYGNRFTPAIDMRGYGIGDGYQNIVVTLDGQRLNSIDMSPQMLGAVPLSGVDRIEITRGSGSVMFGDGAMAGSIQIYTKPRDGVAVTASAGSHDAVSGAVSAGAVGAAHEISASAENARHGGFSQADTAGHRDRSESRNWRLQAGIRPAESLWLRAEASGTHIDTRYPGPLTLAQFQADPTQNGGNAYTHQTLSSDRWRVGADWTLSPELKLTLRHGVEDKHSDYTTWKSGYDQVENDLSAQFRKGDLDLVAGAQTFDGVRAQTGNRTRKDNTGLFFHARYRIGDTTLSAGSRRENVDYAYIPNAGATLRDSRKLSAWDVGVNQRVDDRLTLFANANRAFQAPDIDRFFNFGGTFNAFIAPAISETVNLGLNFVTSDHRIKLTLFSSGLTNEIYYNALTWTNTNIDASRKRGLEFQDNWRIARDWSASILYSWTRALIDRENDGGGAYNGKEMPGVSRHGLNLGLAWKPDDRTTFQVTHVWRSSAYALEDFDNDNAQKQAPFNSTDATVRFRQGNVEWFATVENLLDRKNGTWVRDNAIYPVSFVRNWRAGLTARF
ncbi:MAG: TonB-dependent receptor [Rhodocyclaceae bacterium]|nr:TonB-dependent receptor [Rhodocyclaceae bacterium]